MMFRTRILLGAALALGACDDDFRANGGAAGAGGTAGQAGEGGAGGVATGPHRRALVAASDFSNPGRLFAIDLDARTATAAGTTGEDPVLRWSEGAARVLLVNRFGATNADNVQPLDPASLAGGQISTGNGSNPHDVACVSLAKCYVAAFGAGALPIVDLAQGATVGSIDLASYDPDGVPNADALFLDGTTLYVTLQRLEPAMFAPRGIGQVVVIDTTTDTVLGNIDLLGAQPLGFIQRRGADQLCVTTVGDFSGTQGGIECWSTATRQHTGYLVEASRLGGYPGGWVLSPDGSKGWVAVNKAFPDAELWQFDPATGATVQRLGTSSRITDVALNDRGELWAVDGDMMAGGVRVFSADTGAELTTAPIALGGLPPVFQGGILFLP